MEVDIDIPTGDLSFGSNRAIFVELPWMKDIFVRDMDWTNADVPWMEQSGLHAVALSPGN